MVPAATQEHRQTIIARVFEGMGAASIRISLNSLWVTWLEFHFPMFDHVTMR